MDLRYGLHYDRDYLMDITSRLQSILPIISLVFIYPASFYLLLVEGPTMIKEIRAAYLAYFGVHIFFDIIYSLLMRMYVVPPYGLFYCDGILCTCGIYKPFVMTLLSMAVILPIAGYVYLMMRMHQLVIKESSSRWKLSSKSQLAFMISLMVMLIVNVFGFLIYATDVPNYDELIKTPELEFLLKRGGMLMLFGEPGKRSEFLKEMVLFCASFSFFLPPVIFFIEHAMITLKKSARNATSNKTQQLTRKLFTVFRVQLVSAMIVFIAPLIFSIAAGVVDMRKIMPDSIFAFARFIEIILFTINPAISQLIFILRNEMHRNILRRRVLRISICGAKMFGLCFEQKSIAASETSSFRLA